MSLASIPGVLVIESDRTNGDTNTQYEWTGQLIGPVFDADTILQNFAQSKQDSGFGEVVFNTSMTGYQEILSDPSYHGQMICMTYPHIGNTGINLEDFESQRPFCSGFITHQLNEKPSNWRSHQSLPAFLAQHKIPAITRIDTRALTRFLRTKGVARGVILPAAEKGRAAEIFRRLPRMEERDLMADVTTTRPYRWDSQTAIDPFGRRTRRVVAMDFGIKRNLLKLLAAQNLEIEVVPAHFTAGQILALKPEGIFLSNGPGDPTTATYAIRTVQTLLGQIPIFGVCMGHQLLCLAAGAKTYKLRFGHRGANQPVLNRTTSRIEISSHNHGYAVLQESLPIMVEVTHLNLNDQTIEGIQIPSKSAFSVQYHPEAAPGPHDSTALFQQFREWIDRFHEKQ